MENQLCIVVAYGSEQSGQTSRIWNPLVLCLSDGERGEMDETAGHPHPTN